jgi:hypothetical protein
MGCCDHHAEQQRDERQEGTERHAGENIAAQDRFERCRRCHQPLEGPRLPFPRGHERPDCRGGKEQRHRDDAGDHRFCRHRSTGSKGQIEEQREDDPEADNRGFQVVDDRVLLRDHIGRMCLPAQPMQGVSRHQHGPVRA